MEGKKSFVLYSDLNETIKKLSNDEAGQLFKMILSYVSEENPKTENRIIDLLFDPIKRQLKRDLIKWEERKETRSESGTIGNLKRWNPDLHQQVSMGKITLENAIKIAKSRKESHRDKSDIKKSHRVATIAVPVSVNATVNENETVTCKIDSTQFLSILKSKEFIEELIFKGYDMQSTDRAIKRFFDLNEGNFYESKTHLKNTFLAFIGKKTRGDLSRNKKKYQQLIDKLYNEESTLNALLSMHNIVPIEWKNRIKNEFENHLISNFHTLQNDTHLFNITNIFLKQYSNH